MQRRILAAVAAVVLAGVGAALLYNWVSASEQRAMASMESTTVLVVTKTVPAGTLGAAVAPFVEARQLPALAVVPGAFTDLKQLTDLVGTQATTSQLDAGEQLLASRFAAPNTTTTGDVSVPTGMQQISLSMDATRAVGGTIAAGSKVAIFFTGTFAKGDVSALTLRDVLVVRVQGATSSDESSSGTGNLVYTLALSPTDATRIVYAVEHGKLYMALEPKSGGSETVVVNAKNALR
jgi:pilus assembly protein CpaB